MTLGLPRSFSIVFLIDLTMDVLINSSGAPSSFSVALLTGLLMDLHINDSKAPQRNSHCIRCISFCHGLTLRDLNHLFEMSEQHVS